MPIKRQKKILIIIQLFFATALLSQSTINDITFNILDDGFYGDGSGFDSRTRTASVQPDGKIIVGGDFSSYNDIEVNCIARLNIDGTLDTSFNIGSGFNSRVYASSVLQNGKILVAGSLSQYNGASTNKIARLNSDGSLDTLFESGLGFNNTIRDFVVQPDGKIIAIGNFIYYDNSDYKYIVRLNYDGSLDPSFDPGDSFNNSNLRSISLQADGKVIIGGGFDSFNGNTTNKIARLNTDGSLDPSFDSGSTFGGTINTAIIQSDGKIVVGGSFTSFTSSSNYIERLNSDGSIDSSFDSGDGFNSSVTGLALQNDGRIIVAGSYSEYDGTTQLRLARLNSDGSIDEDFDSGTSFDFSPESITLQSDGKIIAVGLFTSYNSYSRQKIVRINSDGSIDEDFNLGTGFNNMVYSTTLQSDGKILVGGSFSYYNRVARNGIVRLRTDGSLDTTFNPEKGFNDAVRAIVVQQDGKIIVGGDFTAFNGVERNRIARLNSDGSLDMSFSNDLGFNNSVYAIEIYPNGKIVVGGEFTSYDNISSNRIALLNADGTFDINFDVGFGFNSTVHALIIEENDQIYAGGSFGSFNGQTQHSIVRLNPDGSIDPYFNPGSGFGGGSIRTLSRQVDGKIIVGGTFSSFIGVPRNKIARLNTDATLDLSFDVGDGFHGLNNLVYTTTIDNDMKIIVGGKLSFYDGESVEGIVRLNTDGSFDTTFNSGGGLTGPTFSAIAYSSCVQDDNKVLVGGYFFKFDGFARNRIVRLLDDEVVLETENIANTKEISIYPNPSKGTFTITSEKPIGKYVIRDLSGKLIHQETTEKDIATVDIVDQPSGMYFVYVGNTVLKLIKN